LRFFLQKNTKNTQKSHKKYTPKRPQKVLKFDPKFTPFFDPVLTGYMQIRFIFRENPNLQKAPLAAPNRTQKVRFGTPF